MKWESGNGKSDPNLERSMGIGKKYDIRRIATVFVISLGVMSIFADFTYESAWSILGPWLSLLGLSATAISIVSGAGALIGYGFRIFSGRLADRNQRLWPVAIFGYTIQMIAVPLMALAGNWAVAIWLVVQERFGKAIRNPPRDMMLSHAGKQIGYGWAFGLHEALDQLGAVLGPLAISAILVFEHANVIPLLRDYRTAFAFLTIPAVVTLTILAFNRRLYPHPERFDDTPIKLKAEGLPSIFWVYLSGAVLVGVGIGGFPLMSVHLLKSQIVPGFWIPIFYAIAMGLGGIGSLVFGRVMDRMGMKVIAPLIFVSAIGIPLVWFGNFQSAMVGIALWGLGTGVQESLIPAVLSKMIPISRRASAIGILTAAYGISLFVGGVIIGFLYIVGIRELVIFGMAAELAAIPVFLIVSRRNKI
ncbi:MAG: MFS transporter [Thermoplasmatales archaeon]